jgi:hypothetical protein
VDYDRTLRTEKIYDDHRKFLLKIIYDATGQPVVWVPSSKLLPVNVSRSSSGQITVLQRGPTVERVEYDAQGWLSHAKQNPAFQKAATLLQDSQKYGHIYTT